MTGLELFLFICLCVFAFALLVFIVVNVIKNHWVGEIMETIKQAAYQAEKKYPEGHGPEKLQMVLDAVEAKCKDLKIPYNLLVKVITKIVKTIVENYNIIKKC